MKAGDPSVDDAELLAEQREFYRADAEPFDRWLGVLLDERNDDPTATTYRAGRALMAQVLKQWAPLGDVLEIAAGTGRLAELYVVHASSAVLLDTSKESLEIAATRLAGTNVDVEFVEADILEWSGRGRRFDTIIFSAWLHHVPHSRFDGFWGTVESLLARGGRVVFDFPDASITPPGRNEIPPEPAEEYGFYAPIDGISVRDHFGRRWRVVHNLWDPESLRARLAGLGWTMTILGAGLFSNIVWATAHRQ